MAGPIINIIPEKKSELPDHLGGSAGDCWVDEGALTHLIQKFDIKSLVDVGTGLGGQVRQAQEHGLDAIGIDGDWECAKLVDDIIIHDYSTGPYVLDKPRDLGWSVEFLEHVDACYIQNYMSTFQGCKYVLCTHAFPNQGGHHHVNLRDHQYWIDIFTAFGFEIDPETTNEVRNASTMNQRYMKQNSLFFRNRGDQKTAEIKKKSSKTTK